MASSCRARWLRRWPHGLRSGLVTALGALALLSGGCTGVAPVEPREETGTATAGASTCREAATVRAEVVALEQAYVLNRFGAYVPAGMLYALRRDVVAIDAARPAGPGNARLRDDKRPRPLVLRVHEGGCLEVTLHNWLSPQWVEEGGQPPYPTMALGGRQVPAAPAHLIDAAGTPTSRSLKPLAKSEQDAPRTRHASLFVTGLESDPMTGADCPVDAVCGGDGTYVGLPDRQATVFNPGTSAGVRASYRTGSLVAPGGVSVIRWVARREGTFLAHSMGAPVGGEGDGGQIGLGLFAAVNVEPPGSRWYRSQLTHGEMQRALRAGGDASAHPYAALDYGMRRADGLPLLELVDGRDIVHSDLNAVIVRDEAQRRRCTERLRGTLVDGQRCEPAFREFTVVLHDEVHAQQAFPELEEESHPLHYLKDGMGINYGVSSMGSLVVAAGPQRGVGPAAHCPECRAEEFFLSSWANGDPALVLQWDERGERPIGARYPDDPSNVHHSYLADPVVFRNLHAGPKETHVFHLHAHQWVLDASDPNSTYLDSQTISPGATFSYGIEFGGSGNRNFTPGDSIFHCHLYPHFAQGMWELWRVHDVFENGLTAGVQRPDRPADPGYDPRSRSLPDAEVAAGIATPAIVPLPGSALAPMPSAAFRGYPFYIPGEPGHRPPQPALDMDVVAAGYDNARAYASEPARADVVDGGLPRHVVRGDAESTIASLSKSRPGDPAYERVLESALGKGGAAAQLIARKIYGDFPLAFQSLAADWDRLHLRTLAHSGEPAEQAAMAYHEGTLRQDAVSLADGRLEPVPVERQPRPNWWTHSSGYLTSFAPTVAGMAPAAADAPALFHVNGRGRAPGSPYANPCPADAPRRHYRTAFVQTEITVNRHGWFDPQGRMVMLEDDVKDVVDANRRSRLPEPLFFRVNSGDCIDFKSSNLIPSALNADDFQIYTPTDTIGQHIHLVKFDVTSSDGSGNGWNYEDSTFSPDEVRERVVAHNRTDPAHPLTLKVHPMFGPGGSLVRTHGDTGGPFADFLRKGQCPDRAAGETDHAYLRRLATEHPYCGAQRTTQRWWADPILVRGEPGKGRDNTLRTVFTHDHMGPSSHQQHGLYAALVIEPANSVWRANPFDVDGGPQALAERCVAPGLRGIAAGRSIDLAARDPAASDVDDAVRAAFALRASDRASGDDRRLADDCLRVALLGGSDLSRPPVALTRAGGEQLRPIRPRPVLDLGKGAAPSRPGDPPSRDDGGPTSTRAVIVAPTCLGEPDSSPVLAGRASDCAPGRDANQTRREFALAFADFAGVYNVGLEPINPETPRDLSMMRFGDRQVATRTSRPIAISSEDPGTQLVNYCHEPLALRVADVRWNPRLGGFDYRQSARTARGGECRAGDLDCLGDMANAFSSAVHAGRDRDLATKSYADWVAAQSAAAPTPLGLASPRYAQLDARPAAGAASRAPSLADVLRDVEGWRQDFNCALYAPGQWLAAGAAPAPAAPASPDPDPRFPAPPAGTVDPAPVGVPAASAGGGSDALFDGVCAERARAAGKPVPMRVREPWRVFGDPATPILAVREGDPVQLRLIQGAQEAQHVFTMNGVKWRRIPDSPASGWVNAQPLGISEHFEFDVRAPTFGMSQGDYLYFGSSIDQLWDGMWGVLRAYKSDALAAGAPARLSGGRTVVGRPSDWLPAVPGAVPTEGVGRLDGFAAVCQVGRDGDEPVDVKSFDVSAVRVADLLPGRAGAPSPGLVYSQRHGIADPDAAIYVLRREAACTKTAGLLGAQGCFDDMGGEGWPSNDQVLDTLRAEFARGRPVEPMVLRAAAGQCITVHLRNHLPRRVPVAPGDAPVAEKDATHNLLPMIADGFNMNQLRMSNAVGLSVPKLAQNPVAADGANVGLNGARSVPLGPNTQGSLVAPCAAADARDPFGSANRCAFNLVWSATDLRRAGPAASGRVASVPVEFGALPLRSFGDAIQHPAHGLVGALVVGPAGSEVCADEAAGRAFPGGPSREICPRGSERYADHVLVMQDAVSAVRGGFPVGNLRGAEEPDDYGVKAINYRTEPLWARRGNDSGVDFGERNTAMDYAEVFGSATRGAGCESGVSPVGGDRAPTPCDPETPVLAARAGLPLRLHFVHPGGHTRQQGLTVAGHGFDPYPWSADSGAVAPRRCWPADGQPLPQGCLLWQGVANAFGPMMSQTLALRAGGAAGLSKDYLIKTESSFALDGGQWGILRVTPGPRTNAGSTP